MAQALERVLSGTKRYRMSITGGPIQLPTHPMDESCPIVLLIFARGLNFALVDSLAPTVGDRWQER
jgi:hypothetical protein